MPKFDIRLGPDTDGTAAGHYRRFTELLYTLSFPPGAAARFRFHSLTYQLPRAAIASVESVAQTLDRGPAEIARGGGDQILVFRVKGGFRGTARVCPHQQFPLSDGILQGGDAMLRCRRHSYVFRLSDGKGINCPGYKLKVYEVKQEGAALFARAAS